MFADDTTFMYSAETLDDRYIGSDTVCLQKWITCSPLYLKVKKSELIWFCNPMTDIRLQIEKLNNSDSVKYLDIHLDRNFSFDVQHVDSVVKRLSKRGFAVARIWKFVSRKVLILYYGFFIEPIVRYGLLICGCPTSSKLRCIYMVQRNSLKLLFFRKRRESASCFFSDSTNLSVYNFYSLENLKFVLKPVNSKLPNRYLNNLYQRDVKDLTARSVSSGLFKKSRLKIASDKN